MISTPAVIDVPLRTDEDGVIRMGQTRVTLLSVIELRQLGDSPEAIHEAFPTVSLSDIYAVLAYYLLHQSEIDQYVAEAHAKAEHWRQEYEANNPQVAASNARLRALVEERRKKDRELMRFLADENFNNRVLRGLIAALPDLDLIRVQDTEIYQAPDPVVLEWAARENRILLTHDVETMPGYAVERVRAGLPMPGIIEVAQATSYGKAIEELAIIIGAGMPDDFENQIKFVPLH